MLGGPSFPSITAASSLTTMTGQICRPSTVPVIARAAPRASFGSAASVRAGAGAFSCCLRARFTAGALLPDPREISSLWKCQPLDENTIALSLDRYQSSFRKGSITHGF
jgi:hypothetical protein